MSIEQELITDKYTVWQQLRINISLSASWLSNHLREFLAPYDITPKQYNILRILRGQKGNGITILEVRERMIDRMSDASRLIDRLSKKGLVHKCTCSLDKRANRVCITQKGLGLLLEIDEQFKGIKENVGELTAEEAQTLNDLMIKMRKGKPF